MTHEVLVDVRGLELVYPVLPRWLRLFLRSSAPDAVPALGGVDLTVRRRDVVGVIGPNGAGKTSLFRVLLGLVRPTSGSVRALGEDVTRSGADLRRRVGYLPADDRSLFLRYTCRENLSFHGRLHGYRGQALDTRIGDVLELVGLSHAIDRVGVALSSGMRYRLMLARALMHQPELLVLDEPTGPLDPVTAHEFIGLLRDVVEERGIGALISSHRLDDIEALPRRVVLLDEGRIVHDGDVESLRGQVTDRVVVLHFDRTEVADRVARDLGRELGHVVEAEGLDVVVATGRGVGELLGDVGALGDVVDVRVREPALREVMARVLAARGAA